VLCQLRPLGALTSAFVASYRHIPYNSAALNTVKLFSEFQVFVAAGESVIKC
jgi:hypothetical protein